MLSQQIKQLRDAITAQQENKKNAVKQDITDFKSQQKIAFESATENLICGIERELSKKSINAEKQIGALRKKDFKVQLSAIEELSQVIADAPEQETSLIFPTFAFPAEIRDEMNADLQELKKCFEAECYRSAVVLCGRLLETALHRKYFEVAGNDLLEKSPGIGLGNLLARIEEKGIKLDPGLTNQIHLINQVRIYSVHKKQQLFHPTKTQAHAIILYTSDVLKRLFQKEDK